ncbi:hypothetical protein [Ammoniphilus sp. 3BR4]|uniref:YphA family membrane protein n=1 Tax=Ammoniphilus sp. 3BR4 TaxID=3158265 RepID=UPI003465F225
MNDGFLGLIGLWFLLLFLWIGLFDRFFAENNWNKKWVIIILVFELLFTGWTIELPGNGQIAVMSALLPLCLGGWLWVKLGDNSRLHLLTASFLVGASVFLMQLLLRLDPVLMFMQESYMIASFALVLILVAARTPVQQFVLLTLGLVLGDICYQAYLWEKTGHYLLGSPLHRDTWWIALYLLILARLILQYAKRSSAWKRKRAETTS